MKERKYPLFLIDSRSGNYSSDYLVCLHRECGFVAKITFFKDPNVFDKCLEEQKKIAGSEMVSISKRMGNGSGVVLMIEDFLFSFDENNQKHIAKVRSLLKKGMEKFLYGEVQKTAKGDLGIKNQILQQEASVELAKANYDNLIGRSASEEQARYTIALAEATLETLRHYEKFFKNVK